MRIPVELQQMLRVYKKSCDGGSIDALHLTKAVDFFTEQKKEIDSLRRKLNAANIDRQALELRVENLQHRLSKMRYEKMQLEKEE